MGLGRMLHGRGNAAALAGAEGGVTRGFRAAGPGEQHGRWRGFGREALMDAAEARSYGLTNLFGAPAEDAGMIRRI